MRKVVEEGIKFPSLVTLDYAEVEAILKKSIRTKVVEDSSIKATVNKLKKVRDLDKINGMIGYLICSPDVKIRELEDFKKLVEKCNYPSDAIFTIGAKITKMPKNKRKIFLILSWKGVG